MCTAVLAMAGCASPTPPEANRPAPPEASSPATPETNSPAVAAADEDAKVLQAERSAMDCVTGAWVAETAALQALFDTAMSNVGGGDATLIVEGSIVYEFIGSGFALNVLPTDFSMRMSTAVGDVVGTMTGHATGMWRVDGEYIHVVGEDWQMNISLDWAFQGETFTGDTGAESLLDGFTDVDRFECSENELILQSTNGPPLTLIRMTEVS